MKSLDAAAKILNDEGMPLHYRKITEKSLQQNLWQTEGKTPWDTINAQIATDILKHKQNSRFQRTAPGIYALRAWGLAEYTPKNVKKSKQSIAKLVIKKVEKKDEQELKTTLSFTDAAEYILKKSSQKQPLHYREITERILELGLVNTQGQTPEATLYAQILNEIKRVTNRGDTPRFVKHGKGFVGLRKWMGQGLAFQIRRHNKDIRNKLHQKLFAMSPADFEGLVGRLLVALGFDEVAVTKISNDGGIDVRGTLVVGDVIRTRMAVQVKRWKKNIQSPIVQQVRGSLGTHEQGLIITTSNFGKGAREEAERADAIPVALMNGDQLVNLLVENDIGVNRTAYNLIELGEIGDE